MKILAISDWRVQPAQWITDIVEKTAVDVILYAGDDVASLLHSQGRYRCSNGSLTTADDIRAIRKTPAFPHCIVRAQESRESRWAATNTPIYYVMGNDAVVLERPEGRFVRVEYCPATVDEGRRSFSPLYAQCWPIQGGFAINKASEHVTAFAAGCTSGLHSRLTNPPHQTVDIVLSHIPPLGVLDLAQRFRVAHIGSNLLLKAVQRFTPRILICGHSHRWGGHLASLGPTTVVNTASPDGRAKYAHYAVVDTSDWSIQLSTFGNLVGTAVPGLSSLRSQLLTRCLQSENSADAKRMFELREKLCTDFRDTQSLVSCLDECRALGVNPDRVIERAKSRDGVPKVIRPLTALPSKAAYCDVETGCAKGNKPGRLWLVGLLHGDKLRQYEWPSEARAMLRFLRDEDIRALVCWTDYDRKALSPELSRHKLTIGFADLCARVRRCVTWHTYSLGALHAALFPGENKPEGISGAAAGIYADHVIIPRRPCRHCPTSDQLKSWIREKNRRDLLMMRDICSACGQKPA